MTTTLQSIQPNDIIEHEGDLLIDGNVGRGAKLLVKNGTLRITGDVHDSASLTTEIDRDAKQPYTLIADHMITRISNSFADGSKSPAAFDGITIEGTVGNNVRLISHGKIELQQDAGNYLTASAVKSFNAKNIGDTAVLRAETANIDTLASGSAVIGKNATILNCSSGCIINTGGNFHGNIVGPFCTVTAAQNIFINEAHLSTQLNAGNVERVSKYSKNKNNGPE